MWQARARVNPSSKKIRKIHSLLGPTVHHVAATRSPICVKRLWREKTKTLRRSDFVPKVASLKSDQPTAPTHGTMSGRHDAVALSHRASVPVSRCIAHSPREGSMGSSVRPGEAMDAQPRSDSPDTSLGTKTFDNLPDPSRTFDNLPEPSSTFVNLRQPSTTFQILRQPSKKIRIFSARHHRSRSEFSARHHRSRSEFSHVDNFFVTRIQRQQHHPRCLSRHVFTDANKDDADGPKILVSVTDALTTKASINGSSYESFNTNHLFIKSSGDSEGGNSAEQCGTVWSSVDAL